MTLYQNMENEMILTARKGASANDTTMEHFFVANMFLMGTKIITLHAVSNKWT